MKTPLNHCRHRFEDQKDTFDRLVSEDPEFLALCEDYDACVNALRYWHNSKEDDAIVRMTEYRTLVWELQEEIRQVLIEAIPEGSKG